MLSLSNLKVAQVRSGPFVFPNQVYSELLDLIQAEEGGVPFNGFSTRTLLWILHETGVSNQEARWFEEQAALERWHTIYETMMQGSDTHTMLLAVRSHSELAQVKGGPKAMALALQEDNKWHDFLTYNMTAQVSRKYQPGQEVVEVVGGGMPAKNTNVYYFVGSFRMPGGGGYLVVSPDGKVRTLTNLRGQEEVKAKLQWITAFEEAKTPAEIDAIFAKFTRNVLPVQRESILEHLLSNFGENVTGVRRYILKKIISSFEKDSYVVTLASQAMYQREIDKALESRNGDELKKLIPFIGKVGDITDNLKGNSYRPVEVTDALVYQAIREKDPYDLMEVVERGAKPSQEACGKIWKFVSPANTGALTTEIDSRIVRILKKRGILTSQQLVQLMYSPQYIQNTNLEEAIAVAKMLAQDRYNRPGEVYAVISKIAETLPNYEADETDWEDRREHIKRLNTLVRLGRRYKDVPQVITQLVLIESSALRRALVKEGIASPDIMKQFLPQPLTKQEMIQKGFEGKKSFDHETVSKAKKVPGYELDMKGTSWVRYIYATDTANEFPAALFEAFNLHHLSKGNGKLLGWVGGVWDEKNKILYVTEIQSDLLQRTYELRDPRLKKFSKYKSLLENRFDGWYYTFFNQAVREAKARGAIQIAVPTAKTYGKNVPGTYKLNKNKENIGISSIYDRVASKYPQEFSTKNGWYNIPVTENIRVARTELFEVTSYSGESMKQPVQLSRYAQKELGDKQIVIPGTTSSPYPVKMNLEQQLASPDEKQQQDEEIVDQSVKSDDSGNRHKKILDDIAALQVIVQKLASSVYGVELKQEDTIDIAGKVVDLIGDHVADNTTETVESMLGVKTGMRVATREATAEDETKLPPLPSKLKITKLERIPVVFDCPVCGKDTNIYLAGPLIKQGGEHSSCCSHCGEELALDLSSVQQEPTQRKAAKFEVRIWSSPREVEASTERQALWKVGNALLKKKGMLEWKGQKYYSNRPAPFIAALLEHYSKNPGAVARIASTRHAVTESEFGYYKNHMYESVKKFIERFSEEYTGPETKGEHFDMFVDESRMHLIPPFTEEEFQKLFNEVEQKLIEEGVLEERGGLGHFHGGAPHWSTGVEEPEAEVQLSNAPKKHPSADEFLDQYDKAKKLPEPARTKKLEELKKLSKEIKGIRLAP